MKDKVNLVCQEISFAKALGGNDKHVRARAVRKLQMWLESRAKSNIKFSFNDMMRIWRGLYYCMWMSDKPLIQEEISVSISKLIHAFKDVDASVMFIESFYKTMIQEWFTIDSFRLDKFSMLARRFLRESLIFCQSNEWKQVVISKIAQAWRNTILANGSGESTHSSSFTLHFCEIFLQELSKIGRKEITPEITLNLLTPFIELLSYTTEKYYRNHVTENIFHELMKQSDLGIMYADQVHAWRERFIPGSKVSDMVCEKMDDDDDADDKDKESKEDEVKEDETVVGALDPRAGRVNVELPQIAFDPLQFSRSLNTSLKGRHVALRTKRHMKNLAHEFKTLSGGKYPLCDMNEAVTPENESKSSKRKFITLMAEKLLEYEDEFKIKKNKKSKRKLKKVKVLTAEGTGGETSKQKEKLKKKSLLSEGKLKRKKLVHSQKQNPVGSEKNIEGKTAEEIADRKKLKRKLKGKISEVVGKKSKLEVNNKEELNATGIKQEVLELKTSTAEKIKKKKKKKNNQEESSKFMKSIGSKKKHKSISPVHENKIKLSPKQVKSLSEKKISIALTKNVYQAHNNYLKVVKDSPSIPFDAVKQPPRSILKQNSIPTPPNPFYVPSSEKKPRTQKLQQIKCKRLSLT